MLLEEPNSFYWISQGLSNFRGPCLMSETSFVSCFLRLRHLPFHHHRIMNHIDMNHIDMHLYNELPSPYGSIVPSISCKLAGDTKYCFFLLSLPCSSRDSTQTFWARTLRTSSNTSRYQVGFILGVLSIYSIQNRMVGSYHILLFFGTEIRSSKWYLVL